MQKVIAAMLAAVSLSAFAADGDGIKPIPKTSKEAFAQCEEYNTRLSNTYDCRDDFVYKSMKETEARDAAEARARADRSAARAAAEAAAKAQAAKPSPRIGMSKATVVESTNWGKPYKVHRTTTVSGTQEQWVYGSSQYLYFTNGVLTAIQD